MKAQTLKNVARVSSEAESSIWPTDEVLQKLVVVDLATGEARPVDVDRLPTSPVRPNRDAPVDEELTAEPTSPTPDAVEPVVVAQPPAAATRWRAPELLRSQWLLIVVGVLALGEGLYIVSRSVGSTNGAATTASAQANVPSQPVPAPVPPQAPAVLAAPIAQPEVPKIPEPQAVTPTTGSLLVRSDPPGARVTIDGRVRGETPLTVPGIVPGAHAVVIEGASGRVEQTVSVEAGGKATLFAAVTQNSGGIALNAPAELQILEGGQLLGTSRSERILLEVGRHTLDFVNDSLGYQSRQVVDVAPGKTTRIALQFPNGTLNINALPWAEVFLDGRRIGETPLGNVQVAAGVHEITLRNPDLGEVKRTVEVTLRQPARVSVDLRKDK